MKTTFLFVAALSLAGAFVAIAPEAEAAQACTDLRHSWCPGFLCVWDHLHGGGWACIGRVQCVTEPCLGLP